MCMSNARWLRHSVNCPQSLALACTLTETGRRRRELASFWRALDFSAHGIDLLNSVSSRLPATQSVAPLAAHPIGRFKFAVIYWPDGERRNRPTFDSPALETCEP